MHAMYVINASEITYVAEEKISPYVILTHLFVKIPRPGDSEENLFGFRVKLPPVDISPKTQKKRQSP